MQQATIIGLLKRKQSQTLRNTTIEPATEPSNELPNELPTETLFSEYELRPTKTLRTEETQTSSNYLERDPDKRKQIWEYQSEHQQNDMRRAYIVEGPFQPVKNEYKKSKFGSRNRSFQTSWYEKYPSWLEYSPHKDAVFCFICFLFNKQDKHPSGRAFTTDGFQIWNKVGGKKCAFLLHKGKDHNSPHKKAEKELEDFLNQSEHLPHIWSKQTPKQIANNRMKLKSSIDALRWLACQGMSMRGRDESEDSINRGNFLELVKHQGLYNSDVKEVVLGNAPKNASYTSPNIQKEILHIIAEKVKGAIREEIGKEKFCIIVDEAGDVSGKQHMALILRFVNDLGLVTERFFSIVHVPNTTAITLKNEIYSILSHYCFDIKNLRGQGYDGASNIRGRWNGLQALVAKDCPFAYYVHCFAHRLQLALVAAAKEVIPIFQIFSKLNFVVNLILASFKRIDELRNAYSNEISMLVENDELETGTGLNQTSNLQMPGETRWSSHLRSISSLIKMFSATCVVLNKLIDEGDTSAERAEATTALQYMTSFEFIFILHLMKKILEVSESLSQALQRKSQDILNSLHLVKTTKILFQKLRDDGWNSLFVEVKTFCESRHIEIPNMGSIYIERGDRARHQQDKFTVEHHYRVNIFYATIDVQLQELNNRFNEKSVELLTLSCALEPRAAGKFFKVDDICNLVNKFYSVDFTDVEKEELRLQLSHYKVELSIHPSLKKLETVFELCQWLVETRKMHTYPHIFKLEKLILTLPVSTASAERDFSAMDAIKTVRRNKMEDEFFESCMVIYTEREIAQSFSSDSIVDVFRDLKDRRVLL